MSTSTDQINFFTAEHKKNSYRIYQFLREQAPIFRTSDPMGENYWVITRYQDVQAALKDSRLIQSWRTAMSEEQIAARPAIYHTKEYKILTQNMLNTDPPHHTRLRGLVSKAFTTARVEQMRPRIQEIIDQLISVMETRANETLDLLEVFAFPAAIQVICELLGVPQADWDKIRVWSMALAEVNLGSEKEAERKQTLGLFLDYVTELINIKRQTPGDDLLGGLLQAEEQGDRLSHEEMLIMVALLVFAGHESSSNMISNGMLALFEHPDQMDKLKQNPNLMKAAVEEFLRYDGSIETASRFANEDMEIAGQKILKGERVLVVLASADRDNNQFPQANRLDITRSGQTLAFGHGIHYCVGAALARVEGQIAFTSLLQRLPKLRLAIPAEELSWRPSLFIRGLQSLPVRFD